MMLDIGDNLTVSEVDEDRAILFDENGNKYVLYFETAK
jgi:hypothetical protein